TGGAGVGGATAEAPASPPGLGPPAGFVNAPPCSRYYGQKQAVRLPKYQGRVLDWTICGYTPAQLRAAYGVPASHLDGSGVGVAVVDAYASPTLASDVNRYAAAVGDKGFARGQLRVVVPKGRFRFVKACGGNAWYAEQALDVEAVHGMAPGAGVAYYAARSCADQDFVDALDRVVSDDAVSVVTNSWGSPMSSETPGLIAAYEQAFDQGALEGIGFLFSSGDSGDEYLTTGQVQTDYPTSDPLVTSVGGTSVAIGSTGGVLWQTGWGTYTYDLSSNRRLWVPASPPFLYGSGGGYSSFARPSYQDGVVPATTTGRAVPDISMDADVTTGMLIGLTQRFPRGVAFGTYRIGGTSLASPLMAGMATLATQAAGTRLGFLNPLLYQLAASGDTGINDVTTNHQGQGDARPDFVNHVNASGGVIDHLRTFDQDSSLVTAGGWDDVTGIGSPDGSFFSAAARIAG
ncbi:MAG: S53 family peptidase, partial [Acidimicrobiales bacterium]